MTATDQITVVLDDNVLDRLASLICGDDTTAYYRSGYRICTFLEAAGWRRVGEVEGARRAWVSDMLKQRRRDSAALRGVILRLADPREYLDEEDVRIEVVKELNQLLAIEGYYIGYTGSRPQLFERAPSMHRPEMREPIQLVADLFEVVSDGEFGRQLRVRLDEAHTCWNSGACIAAIIMLGSLLEGVLYEFALSRYTDGAKPGDRLEDLINLATERKWIAKDVTDYAHVLRNHRNLVHPRKQITQGYAPEDDTVRIAWNVVVAALNDLAEVPR